MLEVSARQALRNLPGVLRPLGLKVDGWPPCTNSRCAGAQRPTFDRFHFQAKLRGSYVRTACASASRRSRRTRARHHGSAREIDTR